MLKNFNLKMPRAVYGGENAIGNITAILRSNQVRRAAIFTAKDMENAGLAALAEDAVRAAGAEYYILDELKPEPAYTQVQEAVDRFKDRGPT